MIGNLIFTAMPDPEAGLIISQYRTGNMPAGNGGKMDHHKDTSLNDKTFSNQAQGDPTEGISHQTSQGSLSVDSPYRSGQGSLSGDSPYRSGQGSLAGDGSNRSGQGPISDDSSC